MKCRQKSITIHSCLHLENGSTKQPSKVGLCFCFIVLIWKFASDFMWNSFSGTMEARVLKSGSCVNLKKAHTIINIRSWPIFYVIVEFSVLVLFI